MDADMMTMARPDFMTALIVHIAGALGLFLAFGLEVALVILLRRATTVDQVKSALQIGRWLPPLFGGATAGIVLSGLYMGYLDWKSDEEIGWIIAALILFVLSAIVGSISSRRLAESLTAALAKSKDVMTDMLRRELQSRWPGAWLRISICMLLGILVIMVVQPSTLVAIIVLLIAIVFGLVVAYPELAPRDNR